MYILHISDPHGYELLYGQAEKYLLTYDKIIVSGDYVDSFTYSDKEIKDCLLSYIELKNRNPEKVELLLGNHDIQYILFQDPLLSYKTRCSGYRESYAYTIHKAFDDNKNLFKIAYEVVSENGLFLFSHAGLSNKYYKKYLKPTIDRLALSFKVGKEQIKKDQTIAEEELEKMLTQIDPLNIENMKTLADILNYLFHFRFPHLFLVGPERRGFADMGGIFWADQAETCYDCLQNYHQIVGHTPQDYVKHFAINKTTSITYTDVYSTPEKLKLYELYIENKN